MNTEAEGLRRNIKIYYLAGMLVVVGVFVLYWIVYLAEPLNYPYVKLTAGVFGILAIVSGVGIWAKRRWVNWSLTLLLISVYCIFGATHFATGNTSMITLGTAFVMLPITAFLIWRVVKKFVYETT